MGKYIRGGVDEVLSLGTLASLTLISAAFDDAVTEKALVSSLVATYSLDQLTAPQGPIVFGVAHGDYTAAQIEEVIESTDTWEVNDLVAQEIANRKIRIIGSFAAQSLAGTVDVPFNDGKPVKTKLNWILNSAQTLQLWAYNKSASALSTTVPILVANGHVNLWQR